MTPEDKGNSVRATLDEPAVATLVARVKAAAANNTPLRIQGGGSKSFYGRSLKGETLDTRELHGIVAYEPTELVITARAGTPLAVIEETLASHNQMLGFEPPHFDGGATIGGAVASGLSGPARPYHGAARDFVLGVDVIDGRGELLSFGGQVMKNVAGFDVARLLAGSLGTLGVLVQVSLRVLPRPRVQRTLLWRLTHAQALQRMMDLAAAPWPITAMCYDGELLRLRAAGSDEAVSHACAELAPDIESDDVDYWRDLRDLRLRFFADDPRPVWRMSVPPAAPDALGADAVLHDWGGAQRWLHAELDDITVREHAAALGGHATCFAVSDAPFAAPAAPLRALMQRVKRGLDPKGIFNPGRLYDWL
ncbi:MAG: glycolate oxidase subunit GlcE [Gammaproteobacteria bacterium]|nr:glycolate oxidase subunit GlcE [Gammaproteobacteria bacterium]